MTPKEHQLLHQWLPRNLPAPFMSVAILARLGFAYGVAGWINYTTKANDAAHWQRQPHLRLLLPNTTKLVAVQIEKLTARQHGERGQGIVRFANVGDRNAAELLRGAWLVALSEQTLQPEAANDADNEDDWLGFTVRNQQDVLGVVTAVLAGVAHDILEVTPAATAVANAKTTTKTGAAAKQSTLLIPFAPPVLLTIDEALRTIYVDWQADWL